MQTELQVLPGPQAAQARTASQDRQVQPAARELQDFPAYRVPQERPVIQEPMEARDRLVQRELQALSVIPGQLVLTESQAQPDHRVIPV